MISLWYRPIIRAIKLLWTAACAAVILRLGAWILLNDHAGDIRSFEDLRATLRQAVLYDGVHLAIAVGICFVILRLWARDPFGRGWMKDLVGVADDLSDRGRLLTRELPAWPLALRWTAVTVVVMAIVIVFGAALDNTYAALRTVGLSSMDLKGTSGEVFWAFYLWTTALWAFFGGVYIHSWMWLRVPDTAGSGA